MYRCRSCGCRFEKPDYMEICWEDYYGVGSMFPNKNYGVVAECPNCGSDDICETYEGDEEDDDDE